ncbi:MAG: 4Fe-4S dicluster domain-containing protein [bacterium]|nr:4Fe-4S dicluster domain-containing protein [bacterium]
MPVTDALRETAAQLLAEGTVQVVLGWERGTLPLRTTPLPARTVEEAGRLVADATCDNNLTLYLTRLKEERVGLVARPCEARALVEYLREHRVTPGRVLAIGVPCTGMLSRRALEARLGGRLPEAGRLDGDQVVGTAGGAEERIALAEVLEPACRGCRLPDAAVYARVLGHPCPPAGDRHTLLQRSDNLAADARYAEFVEAAARCLRCYACRQACPLCYCAECFTDRSAPAWVGPSDDLSDTMLFHLTRAMHLAGRCVDCGACVRACPVGVDLSHLNLALGREAAQRFGYRPGLDPADRPLVATFRPDDPEEFIR